MNEYLINYEGGMWQHLIAINEPEARRLGREMGDEGLTLCPCCGPEVQGRIVSIEYIGPAEADDVDHYLEREMDKE
jgi:hypothetical protein